MSKAFASNEADNDDDELRKAPVLPPGARNYMTPQGQKALEAEHARLLAEKAGLSEDTVENKQRRRTNERKLEFITGRLNAAHVIDPARQDPNQVLFGANVTVRDAKAEEQTWRIVGIDETDLNKGCISWLSPLARALLEKKVGDTVSLGDQQLTLLKISY